MRIILILLLAGCTTTSFVGKFTSEDATSASALAKATGDAAGQKCYDYIASMVPPVAAGQTGLLYLNETNRQAQATLGGILANCNGVLPVKAMPFLMP